MTEPQTPLRPPVQAAPRPRTGEPRPVDRFRDVLLAARDASTAGKELLVLTHRSPDPDAIGACEGMRYLCVEGFGIDVAVATIGRIHRAENLALMRALDLHFDTYAEIDPKRFFGAILVDTQPEFGHTVVPDDIPMLAIFDHHVPPQDGRPKAEGGEGVAASGNGAPSAEGAKAAPSRKPDGSAMPDGKLVPHRDVRLGVGATCSIVYEYLRDAGLPLEQKVATALFCGVRYDTADLSRNASELDEEAFTVTFRQADRQLVPQIHVPPLPQIYYKELARALAEARQHGPLVIALLGRISHPEFVAELADFFLRMKGCSWVVVGGAVEEEGDYVLSLRTGASFGNAYPLMARLLDGQGSFGGHGHIAGARVPLEDLGESTIASVQRKLRANALAILGSSDEGEVPSEGRSLA